jgi:RNA polymerase sigma-70 factor (ECF subfamily)
MEQTDERLIEGCARREKEAFEELYRRYGDRIASYLYRCLGNIHEAEELCQETFARVWIRAEQCDSSRGRVRGWIYQIASNLVRSRWRRSQRSPFVDLPDAPEMDLGHARRDETSSPAPGDDMVEEETGRIVQNALKELKEEHRIVIILKYFEGMKIREIAPLVGCSEGTVKSRLHHGLRYLGQKIRTRGLCEEDID